MGTTAGDKFPWSLTRQYRQRLDMLKAWADHDVSLYRQFVGAVAAAGQTLEGKRILDIGCGENAPMSLMLHSSGISVTGIDQKPAYRWGLGFKPRRYLEYRKEVGLMKTARKALGELVYDRHYYKHLERGLGRRVFEEGLDLRTMPVEQLEFANGTFDIVHSNATWEHVIDVDTANRELARVLRPGGIGFIEIHLFPSLSGGHDLPWIVPGRIDLDGNLAWGHLRDKSWTAPVVLNRLREADYRRSFESTAGLEILAWTTEFTEGAELIDEQVLAELRDYTQEELTKRSIIVIVRRTADGFEQGSERWHSN